MTAIEKLQEQYVHMLRSSKSAVYELRRNRYIGMKEFALELNLVTHDEVQEMEKEIQGL